MTWFTARAALNRFWPAIPIALLVAALLFTRGQLNDVRADLRVERGERATDKAIGARDVAQAEASFSAQASTAATSYADRLAAREPIILRSTDTVRTYAETPAGRVLCLDADRVRGIDALDRELAAPPAVPAGRGAGAMRTDTGAPTG